MSSYWQVLGKRYHNNSKCINSKSALLALLWVFVVYLVYIVAYQPANYLSNSPISVLVAIYAINGFVLCLFPVAGFLADTKIGRYRTVTKSLYLLMVSLTVAIVLLSVLPVLDHLNDSFKKPIAIVIFILAVVPILLLTASFIGLVSNIVQFGLDQLHDSPADHQSLFIYWFLWVYYLAFLISQVLWNFFFVRLQSLLSFFTSLAVVLFMPTIAAMVILIVSLITSSRHPQWFLMDTAKFNPYRLVYKVTKFARRHKVPIRRSAFTYCEDEVPQGLDLGKNKYGGPFTTEEVEDVKVFYGILKVLFVLAFTQFLNVAVDPLLYFYAVHVRVSEDHNETTDAISNQAKQYLLQDGILSTVLIVLGVPMYLWLVQPFILTCLPGMLKRLGFGILIRIASLAGTLVMDTLAHVKGYSSECMFSNNPHTSSSQDISPIIIQRVLFAFSNIAIYAALNEFICSQSPHSMKGMLLGLSFAIRGVSEFVAVALIVPLSYVHTALPSCGMYYYIAAIVVWLFAFSGYLYVAKKYRYRKRDDFCDVYHYAEEYYSKTEEEHTSYVQM